MLPEDPESELPPALSAWLREHFPNPMLARRALLVPRVGMSFGCLRDHRQLWVDPARNSPQEEQRRKYIEADLLDPGEQFGLASADQPFLAIPGTGGTVRSPFPQLTDAQYYCFVALWRGEEAAQQWLQKPLTRLGISSLQFLDRERALIAERRASLLRKVKDQLFGAEKESDPLSEVWDAHLSEIYPVYL